MDNQKLLEKIADLETQIHNLEKDLIYDSLTGLKTRAFFEEESNIYLSAIANVSTSKRKEWFGFKNLSVLFFDIDNFKKINDVYGHDVGDMVLKKVAETIKKSMREGDTVARWGGEEIVAQLLGSSETDAKSKAEDVRKKIEGLSFESAPDLKVTVSIGVANAFEVMTCDTLVKNADEAMYKAKESGKNKVVAYSELA